MDLKKPLLFLMLASLCQTAYSDALHDSIDHSLHNHKAEQTSQKRINKLDDARSQMLEEYQQLARELDALNTYNQQMKRLLESQQQEKASYEKQLDDIELTRREILPLMMRMVAALESDTQTGLPFLPEERSQRVAQIKSLMDRSDVSTAEKYRRVLEAYQIELDYGRTIEAWQSNLQGHDKTVQFLRLGRLGLYYQTLDQQNGYYWDQDNSSWHELDGSERLALRQAIRIASKQVAPDFLQLRVPAAVAP